MRKTIVLSIIGAFIFTSTFSFAGDKNNAPVTGTAEDFNLSNYILGPGDKLEIKVYRNEELDFTQQIDSSGKIGYPLLGDLQVAGLTPFTLKKKLVNGLSKFFKDPQVMINVTAYQSNTITVIGNVNTTGVITINHQPKLLEIISRSGGFSSNADKTNVIVIRKRQSDSIVLKLNLKKALEGDNTQDILLMKNDIVYVPSDINKVIVLGEVTTPGTVVLDKEISEAPISLLEVITRAGGFGAKADRSGVVIIRKEDGDQTETKKYNIKKLLESGDLNQNVTVLKGDIVFVPKIEKRIVVMGEVTTPGTIVFETQLNIMELLSKSNGFTLNANKNNVLLIRNDKDNPQLISMDIEKALEQGDSSQNIVLQDGDIVYVPRDSKRVIVLGEVMTPGYQIYITPMTILDVISKSGGLLKTADEEKVIVVRQGAVRIINIKNILIKGDIDQNIILQNGDIVYAPMTNIAEFETVMHHVTNLFSSFTQIASPVVIWPQVKAAIQDKSNTTTVSIPLGAQ